MAAAGEIVVPGGVMDFTRTPGGRKIVMMLGVAKAGDAAKAAGGPDFTTALKSSLDQVNQMQLQAQNVSERFAMGDSSVSLSDAMISMQKSSIALQQTIQVRNKLVQAYQDIMNMGI